MCVWPHTADYQTAYIRASKEQQISFQSFRIQLYPDDIGIKTGKDKEGGGQAMTPDVSVICYITLKSSVKARL